MSIVRFQALFKSFDQRPVLRDVFLRLARKEWVGPIRKNGSGKITLLKLIRGPESPTAGTVEIDGTHGSATSRSSRS